MKLDFVGIGVEVGILIIGFAVTWGKLGQRLDDHINLIREWQEDLKNWQKEHSSQARGRMELVGKVEKLLERQQVMNDFVQANLQRINQKLWP